MAGNPIDTRVRFAGHLHEHPEPPDAPVFARHLPCLTAAAIPDGQKEYEHDECDHDRRAKLIRSKHHASSLLLGGREPAPEPATGVEPWNARRTPGTGGSAECHTAEPIPFYTPSSGSVGMVESELVCDRSQGSGGKGRRRSPRRAPRSSLWGTQHRLNGTGGSA